MSVDKLKAVISKKGGLAKNNRFQVLFTPPGTPAIGFNLENLVGALASGEKIGLEQSIYDPRDISILCEQVTLPARSFSTIDYMSDKQSNKFPYTNIDGDVTMHFIVTNDYYAKAMFETWMSGVIDTNTYTLGYKEDYTTDVVIQQLNQQDVPVYGVKLEKAYPIDVSAIALSTQDEEYVRVTVVFAYDKYVVEGPLSSTASALRSSLPDQLAAGIPGIPQINIPNLPTKRDIKKNITNRIKDSLF